MQKLTSIEDLKAIIGGIPTPVFVKDRLHRIVLLNASACEFLGHSNETLLKSSDYDLFPEAEVRVFHAADQRVFQTGEDHENEEQITDARGNVRDVITRKRLIKLGDEDFVVAVISDVTAFRASEARNRYMAFYDALTGLPNRTLFSERIGGALMEARRTSQGCALMYIDLDSFKTVNDIYGHDAGDELLRHIATQITQCASPDAVIARLGGDEFAILHICTNPGAKAASFASRLAARLARPVLLKEQSIRVSASIGIALVPGDAQNVEEAMRHADLALYRAKEEERGGYRFFEPEMETMARARAELEADLRLAIDRDELFIDYQPLVGIESGRVEGFEALLRWRHPTRGLVMPDEFIGIAEDSGLIVELGEWVLRRACIDAGSWDPPLNLSVNVSPVQFTFGDLAKTVDAALQESGLDPSRLELEITEGVLVRDAARALTLLNEIRALGVKIVLDDFGTGYSSLSYFRQFPFDKIKIDSTFIKEMLEDRHARSIVQAVISLGRGLDLQVVAEGVETEEQLTLLQQQGCTQAQGYYISRPMPIDHFVGSVLREPTRHQAGVRSPSTDAIV